MQPLPVAGLPRRRNGRGCRTRSLFRAVTLHTIPPLLSNRQRLTTCCVVCWTGPRLPGCRGHLRGSGISVGEITFANSHGIRYLSRDSEVSISLEAISGQSTGYEFDHACSRAQVNPARVGEQAAFLASRSVGGKDIPTGEYDVILSPMAYADLLSTIFVPALNGRNVLQGR